VMAFATTGDLARALAAGISIAWVMGDVGYGGDRSALGPANPPHREKHAV